MILSSIVDIISVLLHVHNASVHREAKNNNVPTILLTSSACTVGLTGVWKHTRVVGKHLQAQTRCLMPAADSNSCKQGSQEPVSTAGTGHLSAVSSPVSCSGVAFPQDTTGFDRAQPVLV